MTRPTSAEMAQRGRLGAYTQWSNESDWTARTASARAGFEARFDKAVIEKHGVLPPDEHAKYRDVERRLYFASLGRKGVKTRQSNASGS